MAPEQASQTEYRYDPLPARAIRSAVQATSRLIRSVTSSRPSPPVEKKEKQEQPARLPASMFSISQPPVPPPAPQIGPRSYPPAVLPQPERIKTVPPPTLPPAEPVLKQPTTAQAFFEGMKASVVATVQIAENFTDVIHFAAKKVSKSLGVPLDIATDAVKRELEDLKKMLRPRFAPPTTVSGTIAYSAGYALTDIPLYILVGSRLGTRPTLTFALIDAARELHHGPFEAAKAAAKGAVMGYGLTKIGQIESAYKRAVAGFVVSAGPAYLQGAAKEQVLAAGIMGGAFSMIPEPRGVKRVRAKDPEYEFRKPEKDLGFVASKLGSPSLQWVEVEPRLIPILQKARTVLRLATELREEWHRRAAAAISRHWLPTRRKEWERIVDYLNDPQYSLNNLPKDIPRVVETYKELRQLLNEIGKKLQTYLESIGVPPDRWWEEAYWPRVWRGIYAAYYVKDGKEVPLPTGFLFNRLSEAERAIRRFSEASGIPLSPDNFVIVQRHPLMWATRSPQEMVLGHAMLRKGNFSGWDRSPRALFEYIDSVAHFVHIHPLVNQHLRPFLGKLKKQRPDVPNLIDAFENYINRLQGHTPKYMAAIYDFAARVFKSPEIVDRMFSYVRAAETVAKLGLNMASVLANSTQTLLTTLPVLGPKWTAKGIQAAVEYALFGKRSEIIERLGILAMDTKAEQASAIEALMHSLPWTFRDAPEWVMNVVVGGSMYLFKRAEDANRLIACLGAYERARALGMSQKAAESLAERIVLRTQFEYGLSDAITLMNTPLMQTAFQFKTFMIKMIEFMFGLVKPGKYTPRFDPASKELGRFIMSTVAVAGPVGLPGAEIADQIIEWMTGYSFIDELKKYFPRASRGLPGLLGIDMSRVAGFGDWFSLQAVLKPDPINLFGPFPQEVLLLIRAAMTASRSPGRESQELYDRLYRQVSPMARRIYEVFLDAGKAEGSIRDYKGRPIIEDLTAFQRFVYGVIGMTPIELADARTDYVDLRMKIARERSLRGGYLDAIAEAIVSGKLGVAAKLYEDAMQEGIVFDARTIEDAVMKRRLPRTEYLLQRYKNLMMTMELREGNLSYEDIRLLFGGK